MYVCMCVTVYVCMCLCIMCRNFMCVHAFAGFTCANLSDRCDDGDVWETEDDEDEDNDLRWGRVCGTYVSQKCCGGTALANDCGLVSGDSSQCPIGRDKDICTKAPPPSPAASSSKSGSAVDKKEIQGIVGGAVGGVGYLGDSSMMHHQL